MKKVLLAVTGASGQVYASKIMEVIGILNAGNSVGGGVGESVGESVGGSVSGSVGGSVGESVGGSVSGSVGGSVGESVGGSVSGSVGRGLGESVGGGVGGSVGESVGGDVIGNEVKIVGDGMNAGASMSTDSAKGSGISEEIKLDVVFTDTARVVWEDELGVAVPDIALDNNSYYHPYASGSAAADIMIIIPCTMGTIGRIASGATSDLITRAADVMLKERRQLIIVPRETPYNLIHLRNLTTLAEAGAIIAPASPSFYTHPQNLDELIDNFARRVLSIAGLDAQQKKFMTN